MPTIKKSEARERIVWGEVYSPLRPDADGEYMDGAEVKKMSYGFMKNMALNQIDNMHDNILVEKAQVVESFIARAGDPDFIEGSWVVGVHIPGDEDWAKIEKGELNGFSIEAMVREEVVDVEISIPSFVAGDTFPDTDGGHLHRFTVKYDDEGQFLGGGTDIVNDHSHLISRGTATENTAGHSHRFAHVEDILITEKPHVE